MLDVGFSELLVFGIIALLVLGPDKLPEAARTAAKYYAKFKRAITSVQNDIDRELRLSELREQMQNEMQRISDLEQKMQAQMQELQQQTKLAAEQQQQAEPTENKTESLIYHHMQDKVATIYIPSFWVENITCMTKKDQQEEMLESHLPKLKVAV
ncbi:Sec-independent protein translocase protein TatB [Acinetobacter gerneri]|uniref:Sec-independent protein translocase protein TatB n=1 Tax=Acinetobacter gerneri DSM 14967 = CIP 107464 = MTCC 9824 TaxID=1120926 RepID=N8ZTY0_9GAMM|nr:Sec-independent protein translocase protein TatB [Acinetobacter gerneri]ENV35208.1 twin arginine-targeting protein translocase TatB [Acinetobacter gerneri DSM 14967 = CIP 107464 = MTCC 9824]EPR83451.1 Twin-arginine translocation protein TatB [Acinetobacter gerneri DSM 14967 = CIP 107464 = MTCC 9824]